VAFLWCTLVVPANRVSSMAPMHPHCRRWTHRDTDRIDKQRNGAAAFGQFTVHHKHVESEVVTRDNRCPGQGNHGIRDTSVFSKY